MEEVVTIEQEPVGMLGIAAYLQEPKHAQALLRIVNQLYPFGSGTEHLKRIRRATASSDADPQGGGSAGPILELLVDAGASCADRCGQPISSEAPISTEKLSACYQDFHQRVASSLSTDAADALRLHAVCVPDRAPRQSPDVWHTWNSQWPLAVPKPQPLETPCAALVKACTETMLHKVLPLCEGIVSASPKLLGIAAVLVDPSSQLVIATSEGCTTMDRRNPAACAAYMDVEKCRDDGEGGDGAQLVMEHPVMYLLKKLGNMHAQEEDERRAAAGEDSSIDFAQKPYLANNLDMYVSHEPCVMCAMALVHSRIARVFYCFPNRVYGGVGTVYNVHSIPSLNHHYRAYHCVQAEKDYTGAPLL